MSRKNRQSQQSCNDRPNRPLEFVQGFFYSIDLLKSRLIFLRENFPGTIPSLHLNYFDRIENCFDAMKQAWINLENSILLQNDRNEVSALIQSQKINDFQRKVTISHIERLRLIRLIRVMDPSNLTLDLILEKYRLVANYLMNFGLCHVPEI
ncbi:hypothetical protein SSS_05177 [Sarcoptes scabiei]|uniref:Uncharacterized protein n=1 Tax=Sarcoptes scabiei TaxID=52283 RepID=A0A834RFJ1_SARSC|nr:hypothetical protein SSS_05177 [Sarcoptes scabiei]